MADSDAALKRRLAAMELALSDVQATLAEAQGETAVLQGRRSMQGFPLILVHGRSIFRLKGVPWLSTISRCTIIE